MSHPTDAEEELLPGTIRLVTEDEEIKQIGAALLIPHARIIEVRGKYSEQLEILKGLPS